MRISDWSSDVCSSDLSAGGPSPIDPSTAGAYMQYHNGEHHRQRQRSSSGGSTTSVGSVATTTPGPGGRPPLVHQRKRSDGRAGTGDRKRAGVGKRVEVRVERGGSGHNKKKKKK